MKKFLIIVSILLILVGCSNSSEASSNVIAGSRTDMKYDEFNNYLFNDLGLAYTPTFIIIDKNNKIVYFNDGEVTAEQFNQILKDIDNNSVDIADDYKTNLGKELKEVDFIEKGKVNVLEVVWTNCGHCKIQIKENNPAILAEHKDLVFIEYFPLDTQEAVDAFVK